VQYHPAAEIEPDLAARGAASKPTQVDKSRSRFHLGCAAHDRLLTRTPNSQPRTPAVQSPWIEPLTPAEGLHGESALGLPGHEFAPSLLVTPLNDFPHRPLQSGDTGALFSAATREKEERLRVTAYEQNEIAHTNGANVIADPRVAIKALTHYHTTFTERDIEKFLRTRTLGSEQFQNAYLQVTRSPHLDFLDRDEQGHQRYTSREHRDLERQKRLQALEAELTARASIVDPPSKAAAQHRHEHQHEHEQEHTYKGPEDGLEL
jgi:hypothetical protein